MIRFLRSIHLLHDWREETAILDRVGSHGGWTQVRECQRCHRVEQSHSCISSFWWSRVDGLDLVDLRRTLMRFRRRWIMIGGRRVRKGRAALKARAAIREAERLGLR